MAHRTDPIPSTLQPLKGYPPTLKLYQTASSSYWQVRLWVDGRMVKKSTKTANKTEAIKFAKSWFESILLKKSQNLPLAESKSFELVATDLFKEDQSRVDRGERKQSLVDDSKYIYEADLLKFFYNNHVKDINYQRLNDYIAHLKTKRVDAGKEPLSGKTLKNHFILISKILNHAHKLGYIDRLPVFPKIVTVDNPREWLSDDQYADLLKVTDTEIGKNEKSGFLPLTKQLRYLIEFTANSYLRPPDIKTLKHKQITKVKDYLRIAATSKVKASPVVTQPIAADVYAKLVEFNKGHTNPDDYAFFPEFTTRSYAMQTMNRQFNHVLTVAGLKEGPNGKKRVLYSLRHTCIMNTLLKAKNVDLLTLAKNCRTSVEMIERHYASHLTAEMNIHKTATLPESEVFKVDTTAFENLIIKNRVARTVNIYFHIESPDLSLPFLIKTE